MPTGKFWKNPRPTWCRTFSLEDAADQLPFWPKPVTTDAQGHFVFRGLDRTQPFGLNVQHDKFSRGPIELKPREKDQPAEISLDSPQVLEGTITAADTAFPLNRATIIIHSFAQSLGGIRSQGDALDGRGRRFDDMFYVSIGHRIVRTVAQTDSKGHFRATPPPGLSRTITVLAPEGEPYLRVHQPVTPAQGAARQEVNIALSRGVRVRGKVVEESSGKAVAGTRLDFYSKRLILPRHVQSDRFAQTNADGVFECLLPPGSWHVLANLARSTYYPSPLPTSRITDQKPANVGDNVLPDAWLAFDLATGKAPEELTLKVRSLMLKGQVVGPDGRPADAQIVRRWRWMEWNQSKLKVHEGRFEVPVRYPEGKLPLFFLDAEHGLGAGVEFSPKEAAAGVVTVKLAPCVTATVRFVDAAGKPLANYRPVVWLLLPPGDHPIFGKLKTVIDRGLEADDAEWLGRIDPGHYGDGPRTDAEGRLRLPNLIPGATYRISPGDAEAKDFTVAGDKVDLGDSFREGSGVDGQHAKDEASELSRLAHKPDAPAKDGPSLVRQAWVPTVRPAPTRRYLPR